MTSLGQIEAGHQLCKQHPDHLRQQRDDSGCGGVEPMADTLTIVPLEAVPSQSAQIILGGQNCLVRVYTKSTGLFFDLLVDGNPVVLGRMLPGPVSIGAI